MTAPRPPAPAPLPRRVLVRGAAGAVTGLAAATLAGCSRARPPTIGATHRSRADPARAVVRRHDGAGALSLSGDVDALRLATALLVGADAVLVDGTGDGPPSDAARRTAAGLALPLLPDAPGLVGVLDALGTRTVVRMRAGAGGDVAGREVVVATGPDDPSVRDDGLPALLRGGPALVVHSPGVRVGADAVALLDSCGVPLVPLADPDPRVSASDVARLRAHPQARVVGLGDLGPHLAQRVRTVRRAPELPGGGLLPFPARRMVALYGHPSTPGLGMLGEQPPDEAVRRARGLAQEYADLVEEPVLPAFEIIATVATGGSGADGTYSQRTPLRVLRPWVRAAADAGLYVVLDLQPGRASFLDQARGYAELLREPHVGLALDPEWRLGPDERPLQRVGSVDVEEVNAVGRWLARLVREHDLPPKVLTVHQFRTSMVRGRHRLDTGLDEVQWLVHADGQGAQGAKQDTWRAVRTDLPDGVFLGWKNFVDEDAPMLTPRQTVDGVRPTPDLVTYQ